MAEITAIQEAYAKKVIDTVNDLDNVLYEISNESNGGEVIPRGSIILLTLSMIMRWESPSNILLE